MLVTDATKLARRLMDEAGLTTWKVNLDNARRRFGQCRHGSKTISLSRPLIMANDEAQVKDTILHEIAHALVGAGHGHNKVWKRQAAALGANPNTYYGDEVTAVTPMYVGTCPTCKRTISRHRRHDLACGKCSGTEYNPTHKFIWHKADN